MRTTLLPGLLDTVLRNLSRGTRDLSCSRSARCSCPAATRRGRRRSAVDRRRPTTTLAALNAALPNQPLHLAAVLAGAGRAGRLVGRRSAGRWADAIELARRIGGRRRRR